MQTITITFPTAIEPHVFEHGMEEAVRQNSEYRIKVKFQKFVNGENDYTISTEHPQAFYLAGMVASQFMSMIS